MAIEMKDGLEIYFKGLNKENLLTNKEERVLLERAQAGDLSARDELIRKNLKFVVVVAKKLTHPPFLLEDIISEGNLGLIKAIEKFDLQREHKFISYAVWWIRQSILKFMYENKSSLKVPVTRHKAYEKQTEQLQKRENLTTKENVKLWKTHQKEQLQKQVLSLDKVISKDRNEQTRLSQLKAPQISDPLLHLTEANFKKDLKKALKALPKREADILKMRFGLEGIGSTLSLGKIAHLYNLSKERIRQLEVQALNKIRKNTLVDLKAYVLA